MEIIQKIADFYQNHEKLSIALLSIIGTWFFTKLGPALWTVIVALFTKFGRVLGGRLAFRSVRDKYLNWVVLQNQDLNLTGIIGTAQKPKLEQVFISVKISEQSETTKEKEEDKAIEGEAKRFSTKSIITEIDSQFKLQILKWLKSFLVKPFGSKTLTPSSLIFKKKAWAKTRLLLTRDGMDEVLLFLLLLILTIILPSYPLLLTRSTNSFLIALSAFALTIPTAFAIMSLTEEFKSKSPKGSELLEELFFSLIPIAILAYVLTEKIIIQNQWHFSVLIGISILPIIIIVFKTYTALKRVRHSIDFKKEFGRWGIKKERMAKEVGNLINTSDNIAILGQPGAGKSTYVQFIALTFAQEKAGQRQFKKARICQQRFGLRQWYLPILIPLRKVSSFIRTAEAGDFDNLLFEAFRQEILPSEIRSVFSDEYIRQMLKKKKCLFLLDGLDEVANNDEFNVVVREIKGLLSQFPGNKFIVTSRHSGWRGGVSSTFVQTEIKDLDDEQISIFIQSWYDGIERNRFQMIRQTGTSEEMLFRLQRAQEKAKELKNAIREVESIANLAKNPLLLSMICFVHYNKTLPKERPSLYADCSKLLLEQWDVEKGLPQDDIPLTFARKEVILQEIAFAMHSGKITVGSEQKETTSREIIDIIKRSLERFNINPEQAEIFFQKLVNRTGIIVAAERFKDLYSFSHLTFQEFYTAKYLHENRIDVIEAIQQSNRKDVDAISTWWREVIILYSGMVKNISKVVADLCKIERKDLLRKNLQIAAQCMSNAIEKPSSKIENELLKELLLIRSNKVSTLNSQSLKPEVKQFLKRLPNASLYYKYIISSLTNQFKTTSEPIELPNFLLELCVQSIDPIIRFYSLQAILELKNSEVISKLTDKNISAISINLDFLLFVIRVLNSKSKPENVELMRQIYHETLRPMIQVELGGYLFRRESYAFEIDMNISMATKKSILEELAHKNVSFLHSEIRELLMNLFFHRLRNFPGYFFYDDEPMFRVKLSSLFDLLLGLDNQEQKTFHMRQIFEMLKWGSYAQQTTALFLLAGSCDSVEDVTHAIINKLLSPSSKVRSAAIAALRHLNLDELHIEKIKNQLSNALEKRSRIRALINKGKEMITGNGDLGKNINERIEIVATLIFIGNVKYEASLIDLLSRPEHLELSNLEQLLQDLKGKLNHRTLSQMMTIFESKNDIKNLMVLAQIVFSTQEYREKLEDQIIQILFRMLRNEYINKRLRAKHLSRSKSLKPKIKAQSEEYHFLLELLGGENINHADAAFEIIEVNNLV